ncbi:4-phosphopantetheinyl transferase [Streptomyces sp. NPDC006552]|uniref:4'-phosphopantetheinyl transferase family protein n=1 Tax=Streptomyces sp. NPDC006552 TaxID=3157179 RepID=UPI0033A6FACD
MSTGAAAGPTAEQAGGPALVVVARTAEVLAGPGADERTLAGWERRRLDLVRVPARRDDVLAARLLLRWCVTRLTGGPPHRSALRQHCPDCDRDGHGRPFLPAHPGLGVSMSHADGLVAAAVGSGPVGVDVEPEDRVPPRFELLRRRFPAAGRPPGDATPPNRRSPAVDGLTGPVEAEARFVDGLTRWVEEEARFKAGDAALPVHSWNDAPRGARAAVACAGTWWRADLTDLDRVRNRSAGLSGADGRPGPAGRGGRARAAPGVRTTR